MMNLSLGTMLLQAKQDDIRREVERRRVERLADGRAIRRGHFWVTA
jgi:hypothetical protein